MSLLLVFWGQLVAHDIVLSHPNIRSERMPIQVPAHDSEFDPEGVGDISMPFTRTAYSKHQGDGLRIPANFATSRLDGSTIYGSESSRSFALRLGEGGKLRVKEGGLPSDDYDLHNERNKRRESESLIVAGDTRANENVAILAIHTLLVLEHNRLAEQLSIEHPDWCDDELFEAARRLVVGIVQHITYEEFVPALVGRDAIPPYAGYQSDVDHTPSPLFTGAAFRVAHSQIPGELNILPGSDPVSIQESTFRPSLLERAGGVSSILERLGQQPAERVDLQIADAFLGRLFGEPRFGGIDLLAIDVQRGRDLELPTYVEARSCLGLEVPQDWAGLAAIVPEAEKLGSVYECIDALDVFPAALAEAHVPDACVGPLFHRVLSEGFVRLRDGDDSWYEERLSQSELEVVRSTSLASLIQRHSR